MNDYFEYFLMSLFAVVVLIITYLVYKSDKKEKLDQTFKIVGFFITVISIVVGIYTYYENIKRQNAVAAYGIYSALSRTTQDKIKPVYRRSDGNDAFPLLDPLNLTVEQQKDYEEYQWFVGDSLFQFESILALDDPGWDETIEDFIKIHQKYISNNSYLINNEKNVNRFPCNRYSEKIQKLIEKVVKKGCPEKPKE